MRSSRRQINKSPVVQRQEANGRRSSATRNVSESALKLQVGEKGVLSEEKEKVRHKDAND